VFIDGLRLVAQLVSDLLCASGKPAAILYRYTLFDINLKLSKIQAISWTLRTMRGTP